MNHARIDATFALAAALFVLVGAMLFSSIQMGVLTAAILALVIAYSAARGHRRPR